MESEVWKNQNVLTEMATPHATISGVETIGRGVNKKLKMYT